MKQKEIESIAANLLLTSNKKIQFPIILEPLLSHLNIEIIYSNLGGPPGYILHTKGAYRVYIDNAKNHTKTFTRFTIAHEIAHVALGHLTHRKFLSHKQKEQEANQLAAAILMPFHFMVAYRNYQSYILSRFMWVSEEAIDIRRKTIQKDPLYHKAIQKKQYTENLVKDFRTKLEGIL